MHNPRGRNRASGLALYLLLGQMAQIGFDKIPPVTLASIVGQVALFLQLFDVHWMRSDLNSICISALHVWYRGDWKRLLLATFFHADEWHLYFNMTSMLWKGNKLEKTFGSVYFLFLVAVFSVLVNVILVALSMCADHLTHDHLYITQCAVGFSGVLFALKVVLNDMDPTGIQYIMGFPVPSRFVCWAELILIHILVPNASFLGHLSGIVAGLLYVKGPLRAILNIPFSIFTGVRLSSVNLGSTQRNWGSGTSGIRDQPAEGMTSRRDYFRTYTGGLSEVEQINHAIQESIRHGDVREERGGASGHYPDMSAFPNPDDLRRRRLNRFTSS